MFRHTLPAAAATLTIFCASLASAPAVVITEIMYNPASTERKGETEWVEIANLGREAVQIKQWRLATGNAKTAPFDASLAPGAVAVLINADAVTEEQFRAAWDPPAAPGSDSSPSAASYSIILVKGWRNLPNDPKPGSALQLLDAENTVVREVRYQSGDGWPKIAGKGGPSIWLTDISASDAGLGSLWRESVIGQDGAVSSRAAGDFSCDDIGSPGIVPGLNAAAPTPQLPRPEPDVPDEKDKPTRPRGNDVPY